MLKYTPIVLGAMLLASPMTALASNNYENVPQDYKNRLNYVDDTTIKYTTDNLNVRVQPSTSAEIAYTLPYGSMIDILLTVDDWTLILDEDSNFYFVHSDYLSDTKPLEKPPEPKKSYSDEDLYVLAHVLAGEMMGQSWEDNIYTGSVVLNRVKSDKWKGNTIKQVVFAKGQYSCVRDGNYYREPTDTNWSAAKYLLEHGSQIPYNVVFQSAGRQGTGVWKKTKSATYCYGNA